MHRAIGGQGGTLSLASQSTFCQRWGRDVKWYLFPVGICFSLNPNKVEHLFICLLVTAGSLLILVSHFFPVCFACRLVTSVTLF